MAIPAHRTARARTIRWSLLAAGGLVAGVAVLSAFGSARAARNARLAIDDTKDRQRQHKETADALAVECHLRKFSDDASLDTFPMDLGRFQSKSEAECARKISIARADLIQDLVQLSNGAREEAKLRRSTRFRAWMAVTLAVVWAASIYLAEIRPRSRSSWKSAAVPGKGAAAPTGGISA